jgi:hypothetical protein
MPHVEFEAMIPVFDRAKTVHTLERAVTVIGKGKSVSVTSRESP